LQNEYEQKLEEIKEKIVLDKERAKKLLRQKQVDIKKQKEFELQKQHELEIQIDEKARKLEEERLRKMEELKLKELEERKAFLEKLNSSVQNIKSSAEIEPISY